MDSSVPINPLVRHPGEEVVYVPEGRVEVPTNHYDPVVLEQSESIYIDSLMNHAYLAADGCKEAVVLGVCASNKSDLMGSLISLHEDNGALNAAK